MGNQTGSEIEQGVPKVETRMPPKPAEPPKESPLREGEQNIVDRIAKDGDPDGVLGDIAGKTPQKSEEEIPREPEVDTAGLAEDLRVLWPRIPQQDKVSDPIFFELSETFKGDVGGLVSSKLEWYRKQLDQDSQGWGQFQVREYISRLREHAVMALGEDVANKLLAEAKAQKGAEMQKELTAKVVKPEQSVQAQATMGGQEHEDLQRSLFEGLKRPYGAEDVQTMQQQFAAFEKYRKEQKAKYVIDDRGFYEFLTTGTLSGRASSENKQGQSEKLSDPRDYDTLIVNFYRGWRDNLIKNKAHIARVRPEVIKRLGNLEQLPSPKTLEELRELYRKNPELNKLSAVSYQDGVGEKGRVISPFVHFHGHRYSGYEHDRGKTQVRLYLNPPQEALPKLANEFVRIAQQEGTPFYFKIADFSLPNITAENLNRRDRMIFYTDKENAARIAGALEEIRKQNPDWFENRPLPPLTAKVADGVGVAEDPSDYQNKKFSTIGEKETSFNWIRARFLREVWQDATRDVLVNNPDLRPRGGRTLREIFNDAVPGEDKGHVNQLWQNGLSPDRLDDRGKRVLQDALRRTMADVMPSFQPASLIPYIEGQIRQKAGYYGINPDNLALNAK